jgi:hypothetical protein
MKPWDLLARGTILLPLYTKHQEKETLMKAQKERTELISRRSVLTGSALLLTGGIAGRITNAYSAPVSPSAPAPPLPWKWPKLDPLEAGRRAYRAYLTGSG